MKAICKYCGIEFEKSAGHLNRANKLGVPVFCSREHHWESRRIKRSDEEKKAIKKEYDKDYHTREVRKESKRRYNQTAAGRAAQKRNREQQKEKHLQYCRTPEYRAWKQQYDQEHQSKKHFGDFWEAAILLGKISQINDNREAVKLKGTVAKTQKRKRAWLKTRKSNLAQ